jgi:MerR family copper efflux transcriptional regulator
MRLVPQEKSMQSMGIGTIARRAGVSIDTIRYYERNGLLAPAARLASGYRRYDDLQLARLRFIRNAQELGFTLKDIRELLGLSRRRDVAQVKRAAQKKLDEVQKRLAALERIRDGLTVLIDACPGHGRAERCPILRALGVEAA